MRASNFVALLTLIMFGLVITSSNAFSISSTAGSNHPGPKQSPNGLRISFQRGNPLLDGPRTAKALYYPHPTARRATTKTLLSAATKSTNDDSSSSSTTNQLDQMLSRLTSWFPFWVLSFATLGLWQPGLLQWVNKGQLITCMLASVMVGTGLTLERKDFTDILWGSNIVSVPLGVACQFLIMPFTANFLGRNLLLSYEAAGLTAAKALFLGLILVGCSPGGTASNLVSLIAGADVALSVILTACSTLLASAMTPLLVKFLVGSTIAVSGKALVVATARVVLLPVLAGMMVQSKAPKLSQQISRFTPFGSVLLIAFICGGVVAENSALLLGSKTLIPRLFAAVGLLHSLGFAIGYLVPRMLCRRSETTARTISIETGMQNSALAVVLARGLGAPALASLPGALSATMHSCLGSILAAYWLVRPPPETSGKESDEADVVDEVEEDVEDDQ